MTHPTNPKFFLDGLKEIAQSYLSNDELLLCRWWSNKYKRPANDPLLLAMTFEELYVEFLQDQIVSKKQEAISELPEEMANDFGWEDDISEEHDSKIMKRLGKKGEGHLERFVEKAKKIESDEFEDSY